MTVAPPARFALWAARPFGESSQREFAATNQRNYAEISGQSHSLAVVVLALVFSAFLPSEASMKISPAFCSLAIIAICSAPPAVAQGRASLQARIAARQELELAKLDLQNYWQIEYPRQRRELDLAIELTQAEIDGNQAQQESLRPFTRFTIGEPFPLTIANLRICRQSAELRLNDLQAQRNFLIRFHGNEFRILQLRVQAARQRVADLEVDEEVAAVANAQHP